MNDKTICPNCKKTIEVTIEKCPYCGFTRKWGIENTDSKEKIGEDWLYPKDENKEKPLFTPYPIVPSYIAQVSGATFTNGETVKIYGTDEEKGVLISDPSFSLSKELKRVKKENPDKEIMDVKFIIAPRIEPRIHIENITKQKTEVEVHTEVNVFIELLEDVEELSKDISNSSEKYDKVPSDVLDDLIRILGEIKLNDEKGIKGYLKGISKSKFFDWFRKNKRGDIIKSLPLLLSVGSQLLGMLG